MNFSKKELEKLLKEAERAHGKYEKELGHRDENWASWYAQFIIEKLKKERGYIRVRLQHTHSLSDGN